MRRSTYRFSLMIPMFERKRVEELDPGLLGLGEHLDRI